MGVCHLQETWEYNKYEKCFLDTATKTKLVALKTATKQQENS